MAKTVKKWSQPWSYKTKSRKTKTCSLKPTFLLSLLGNGAPIRIFPLTHHLRAAGVFHVPQGAVPNTNPPRWLPNEEEEKEEQVKPALSTTGSSGVCSLSSSYSSNIIMVWWTAAVFQHCQHNILNKNIKFFNIALTAKTTNTGMREMTI